MQGSMQQHPPSLMQLQTKKNTMMQCLMRKHYTIVHHKLQSIPTKCNTLMTTADNKLVDKTFQQFQQVDHKPYSACQTPNTPMPFQKHSALLCNTHKYTSIYKLPGYKMDLGLKPCPANSNRNQQLNLLDKIQTEICHLIETMTSQHTQLNQIYPLDVTKMMEHINRHTEVQTAKITEHANLKSHPV